MKSSEIALAQKLVRDLKQQQAMRDKTQGYPRQDGVLCVGDEAINLPHSVVDRLLSEEYDRIQAAAKAIGLEMDE